MEKIGSVANPFRVAVVGSGPAGFYAAEGLLKQEEMEVRVDLLDRLPTPYGLVRGGVAPDHQKIKSVIKLYERTAARPGFRFLGNVDFGRDVSLETLLAHYHHVLFCTGADSDRRMGIPGEELPGSFPATEFVGWYNGHPDYRDLKFDLTGPTVAVVGNGNVAMDVVRILAKPIEELKKTDIADYALEALEKSGVREIYLLGRRGPAQAAFTNPEIRELCAIDGVDLVVRANDLELDPLNQEFLDNAKAPVHRRNMEILTPQLEKGEGDQGKKIRSWFFTSPVEVLGKGGVERLRLEKNQLVKDDSGALRAKGTGEFEEISVQLLFRSIGYKGSPLPGVPFDDRSGTIPNQEGRVLDAPGGKPLGRVYVAGWIKRGPSGVIGTNKPDSLATVKTMLADLAGEEHDPERRAEDLVETLAGNGLHVVSFSGWQKLDRLEQERGESIGRPRVKFTSIPEMLAALKS